MRRSEPEVKESTLKLCNVALRQRFDNILGWNRPFAQNLPSTVLFEVHDRR